MVSIALGNFSGQPLTFKRSDFLLDYGQGEPAAPSTIHTVDGTVELGRLEPGTTMVGLLPFEIARGARQLTLHYSPACDQGCSPQRLPLDVGSNAP